MGFSREPCFVECARHDPEPPIASSLSDAKRGVPHSQARMTPFFDIRLRTAESKNEEIAEPVLSAFQIARRIHRAENFVARDLAVERLDKALESFLAHNGVNLMLFHCNRS